MKHKLDELSRKNLISYRLSRAEETIKEAEFNASGGFYNVAINRLYYSSYYAVLALLLNDNITANSHAGVKSMFHLHYILTGKLPKQIGKYFSILMESRQSGDYEDFMYHDEDDYNRLLVMSKEILENIKKYL